jgi:NAD(P)-dependent dehydrogenase (short-subunit alcohol dehydrogenase family)
MKTSYCVIGCTRGTGLQIASQLAERGAPVLGVARDPAKARDLLPAAVEIRAGDVTDPGSLRAAQLGACRAIFFAVDITGGIGGRGFFKPANQRHQGRPAAQPTRSRRVSA